MTFQIAVVLGILAFMIVALLGNLFPYGVTGMLCCVALVIFGIFDIPQAFSGLSSSTTIMVACMIVVASTLGKTSIVGKLRGAMTRLQTKHGSILILMIFAILIPLSQLMGQMACLSIMLLFAQTLDEDSEISPGRIFFVLAVLNCFWVSRIPIGMGAAMPGIINAFYEGMVDPSDLLGFADYLKIGIIPSIVGTVYAFFCYRMVPKTRIQSEQAAKNHEQIELPKGHEALILLVFLAVTAGFMFQKRIGNNITNIIPAAGVLALIVFKVLPLQEAVKTLTSDTIWMVAGMQAMSNALSSTGVGELIGKAVLKILGSNPSGLVVLIVFAVIAAVMTNFLSNMGTMAVLCPIAASTALAGGMNVKTVVLVTAAAAWLTAFVMPTGSSAAIMAYGTGNHNPLKTMRFTLPLVVLLLVSLIISANIFYPIYG